jgi:C_GCAxxG_C_C family probable redox protein
VNLLYAQNCAQATLLSLQTSFASIDDTLVKAATNFEGGVVGCGSTCGVVSGGILGIGAVLSSRSSPEGPGAREQEIHHLSRHYLKWFENRFGTTLCRERTHVDFATASGLVRYFVPGLKLLKCLKHIGEAVSYLTQKIPLASEKADLPGIPDPSQACVPRDPHCACSVFRNLVAEAGERFSVVEGATTGLWGGVAMSGAACGALTGAILGMGLEFGCNLRAMSFTAITSSFVRGHHNLLRHKTLRKSRPEELPGEAFARSRYLADGFQDRFGSLHCLDITGREFSGPEALRMHLQESDTCREVLLWCEREAAELIGTRQSDGTESLSSRGR